MIIYLSIYLVDIHTVIIATILICHAVFKNINDWNLSLQVLSIMV